MRQSDQAAAPFVRPILIPGAEDGIEEEPAGQTAGHLENNGKHHAGAEGRGKGRKRERDYM